MNNVIYADALMRMWRGIFNDGKPLTESQHLDDDEMNDADLTGEMTDYGNITDYNHEDELGYNDADDESAVTTNFDNDEMNGDESEYAVDDAEPVETDARPKKKSTAKVSNSRGTIAKDIMSSAKAARSGLALDIAARLAKVLERFTGNELSDRCSDMFAKASNLVEEIKRKSGETTTANGNLDMVADAQTLIWWVETLCLSAKADDCLPNDLPSDVLDNDTIANMYYLSAPDSKLRAVYLMRKEDRKETFGMVDPMAVTRLIGHINAHISGAEDGRASMVPAYKVDGFEEYDGEPVRKVGSFHYHSGILEQERNGSKVNVSTAGSASVASEANIIYLGTKFPEGENYRAHYLASTYAIPNNLMSNLLSGMAGKKFFEDKKHETPDSVLEKFACEYAFYGPATFKKTYSTAPTLSGKITISNGGYIGNLDKAASGQVSMTSNIGKIVEQELTAYLGTGYKISEAERNTIQTAINDLKSALGSKSGLFMLNSPALCSLLTGNKEIERKSGRRKNADGDYETVKYPPEPLFHFFSTNTAHTQTSSTGDNRDMDRESGTAGAEGSYVITDRDADMAKEFTDSGNASYDNTDIAFNEVLDSDVQRNKLKRIWGAEVAIPTSETSEKEKIDFAVRTLSVINDVMGKLGCKSKITFENGCHPVSELDANDRNLYGDSIVAIWKSYADKYKLQEGQTGDSTDDDATISGVCASFGERGTATSLATKFINWLDTFTGKVSVTDLLTDPKRFTSGIAMIDPVVDIDALFEEVIETLGNRHGEKEKRSEMFKAALGIVNYGAKKGVVGSITSDEFIGLVSKYINDKFNGDLAEAVNYGASNAPEADGMYEWCAIRFFTSAIDDYNSPKVISPVSMLDGDTDLDDYDIMFYSSPKRVGAWFRDVYMKSADRSELLYVLAGMIIIGAMMNKGNTFGKYGTERFNDVFGDDAKLSRLGTLNPAFLPAVGEFTDAGSLNVIWDVIRANEPIDGTPVEVKSITDALDNLKAYSRILEFPG